MLSTVHETVIQHGASFNLGISKFPGNYSPRGHKYLEDFDSEPIPKLTYRVGGVLLQKELILDTNRDRVMIDIPYWMPIHLQPSGSVLFWLSEVITHSQ
jgi:hypothetical protein